jgi:hypothetical protein
MKRMSDEKYVCAVCGALFVEGKGFVEPHVSPCANERYGWNFVGQLESGDEILDVEP